jgi:TonB family protein
MSTSSNPSLHRTPASLLSSLQRGVRPAPVSSNSLGVWKRDSGWRPLLILALSLAQPAAGAGPSPSPTPPVFRIGGDVKPPVLVRKVEIQHPRSNRQYTLGVLILEGVVGKDGRFRDLKILSGPMNSFAKAALAAVRQWEYKPATRKGKPVDVYMVVTVTHIPAEPDA